jgi:hypothetical protein
LRAAHLVLWIALALTSTEGRAATCPAIAGAGDRLAALDAELRIGWVRARLEAERPRALLWAWTWGIVDGGLTVGQLAAIPFASGSSDRAFLAAGAATSALGVVQILVLPITPPREDRAPSGAEVDLCATLAALERSFARSARNEAIGSGAGSHLANLAINGGVALGLGLSGGGWEAAAVSFGIGFLLGEAQILTQPTALAEAMERYRAGEVEPAPPQPVAVGVGLRVLTFEKKGTGLGLVVRF